MSWNLLERFIESDHFNNDPSLSVAYLSRYADHVGIHYVLCSKLRQFTYEEIEFFLPQLCHLLMSVDNESMALEEFILDLCEESVHGALLTFWLFQSYLHDLNYDLQSESFKTCQRIYNKVQSIVFGGSEPSLREKIKENILPVTVLASLVLTSVATPFLPRHAGPLAIAQARKPRQAEEMVLETAPSPPLELTRSHSDSGHASRPRKHRERDVAGNRMRSSKSPAARVRDQSSLKAPRNSPPMQSGGRKHSLPQRPAMLTVSMGQEARLSSSSLPEFRPHDATPIPTPPQTANLDIKSSHTPTRRHHHHHHVARPLTPSVLSHTQKIRLLRANYFRSETQLLTALEDISNRLVSVPKPARLSALRAELALIAQDLPAEVDVPVICPPSLVNGAAGMSQHHRIVRLNPAEATSLNSADRVPYLLMVEVLRDDFNFDPDTDANEKLLSKLLLEKGASRRRLFDITNATREIETVTPDDIGPDSVFEPANGDLGNTDLIQDPFGQSSASKSSTPSTLAQPIAPLPPLRSSTGADMSAKMSSFGSLSTPRTSDTDSGRSASPKRRVTMPMNARPSASDPADVSALATHMRTAAQMLAQLDVSGAKRPKVEVAAIKAKIIASMQNLEEQSFTPENVGTGPSFDTIMVNASSTAASHPGSGYMEGDDALDSILDPTSPSAAGAARMENDQKTGGVQRRGDRDDPSAAMFGEEWSMKKERIRRSSPYGRLPNWDLLSVIVKTGADLRQEAFACQLIEVCAKIWQDAEIPVWVKRMRILVTGESSGLIETITNGVSLHSIKRSLTLSSIATGSNPRKRFATLSDHFVKTFGEPDSTSYAVALDAFTRSLAAYSVISYILQLKDRHNGNILIDNSGHIIHIDFGFMLSNSPGSMGFEAAPFKLTQEYIDVLGGVASPAFEEFKRLCKVAFQALRKEAERIIMLVEMMGKESKMPCFAAGVGPAVNLLRARFMLQLSREEAEGCVDELVAKSAGSYYTRLYDTFQYRTQGIY